MARDNFSMLFAAAPPSATTINDASKNTANLCQSSSSGRSDNCPDTRAGLAGNDGTDPRLAQSSAQSNNGVGDNSLLRGFPFSDMPTTATTTSSEEQPQAVTSAPTITTNDSSIPQNPATLQNTKPGTESIQYLKRFGSNIMGSMATNLKPIRELQLAEKLNGMNVEIEEMQKEKEAERLRRQSELEERDNRERRRQWQHPHAPDRDAAANDDLLGEQSEQLARKLQAREEEEECERIRAEADTACRQAARRYDALVKFAGGCPGGTYEEFVEFLLMGGGRSEDDDNEGMAGYDELLFENFYDENSEYRRLWNDNLMLGLPETALGMEGRSYVPAATSASRNASGGHNGASSADPWQYLSAVDGTGGQPAEQPQRQRTFSEDERLRNFGQALRQRTLSEGARIKEQIAQVDKESIRQGLGSAVNAISNVSSFALKPLRDLQLAEKLNAMNIDMEEEEARRGIDQYNRMQEERRDMEEMMRLKREAEESCLNATREHLMDFIKDHPDARYHEWIEDVHPENAHAGTLLEGLGKTIDHRFFVEESDHRLLWNDNLFTYVDPNTSAGRDFVPARARQTNDCGEMVIAADILTGLVADGVVGDDEATLEKSNDDNGKPRNGMQSSDLIAFD